jgi:hypothetical protein
MPQVGASTDPAIDPARAFLEGLEGEWRGGGSVETPTSPAQDFTETMRFWRRSETSVDYWQRAVGASGELLHDEVGVWRLGSAGRLELTIAIAGSVEVAEGAVTDRELETATTSFARAETSTRFAGTRRRYHLGGDRLDYDVELASTNFPLSFHLRATVRRVARDGRP